MVRLFISRKVLAAPETASRTSPMSARKTEAKRTSKREAVAPPLPMPDLTVPPAPAPTTPPTGAARTPRRGRRRRTPLGPMCRGGRGRAATMPPGPDNLGIGVGRGGREPRLGRYAAMHFEAHSPAARRTDLQMADLPTSVEAVIHRREGDRGVDICQEKCRPRGRDRDSRFVFSASQIKICISKSAELILAWLFRIRFRDGADGCCTREVFHMVHTVSLT